MPDERDVRGDADLPASTRMTFPRRIDALAGVFAMCGEFCAVNAVDASRARTADFVLEEVFTNLVKYNPGGAGEIEIGLELQGVLLALVITDFDSDRFDMREAAEVDVDCPLDDRAPGGLGIHLIKKFAERIDYEYVGRRSSVTIYLSLE